MHQQAQTEVQSIASQAHTAIAPAGAAADVERTRAHAAQAATAEANQTAAAEHYRAEQASAAMLHAQEAAQSTEQLLFARFQEMEQQLKETFKRELLARTRDMQMKTGHLHAQTLQQQ